ncbi:putative Rossmann fold nucleotide-binding protein [Xylaria digitata]|nr:putative Rossmann fold nucleotide-binding protein [Xylaria digitata]
MPLSVSQPVPKAAVVCVFCGAAAGSNPVYLEAARALALYFHQNNIQLVYGGGTVGLMGELAKTLVSLSGPEAVHGVIPNALLLVEEGHKDNYVFHGTNPHLEGAKVERIVDSEQSSALQYGKVTVVPDMHTRKRLMAEKVQTGGPGSGFVALPGGFGTMEEIMEMTTWNQLGIQRMGVALLNINGYWNSLLSWIRTAVEDGFLSPRNAEILVEIRDPSEVFATL